MKKEMIKCQICGKELSIITDNHLVVKHQMKRDEYIKKFPDAPLISPYLLEYRKERLKSLWLNPEYQKKFNKSRSEEANKTRADKLSALRKNDWQNPEYREKQIKVLRENGINHSNRQYKKEYTYTDRKGRIIQMNSSWEVAFAFTLDRKNLNWDYEIDRIPVILNGRKHYYIPDFKLQDNKYVEIKGWTLKKDLPKLTEVVKQNPISVELLTTDEFINKGIFTLFGFPGNERPRKPLVPKVSTYDMINHSLCL